jgi:hypothetical protein
LKRRVYSSSVSGAPRAERAVYETDAIRVKVA